MGITLSKLEELRQRGILIPGGKILDIGSSNLYSADAPGELKGFLARFGKSASMDFIERLAAGSVYNGAAGSLNSSFAGELLEAAGMTYQSIDIASGYKTRMFDLNTETLPADLASSFDLVMNFGTTEHVINQLNAFRVIHDAVKVDGYIVHEIPTAGYIDHGFFCYTPRFLFEMADWNSYEIVEFAYHGPVVGNDIYPIVRSYGAYFPKLLESVPGEAIVHRLDDITSYIVLKKTVDQPFRIRNETSTSVHAA